MFQNFHCSHPHVIVHAAFECPWNSESSHRICSSHLGFYQVSRTVERSTAKKLSQVKCRQVAWRSKHCVRSAHIHIKRKTRTGIQSKPVNRPALIKKKKKSIFQSQHPPRAALPNHQTIMSDTSLAQPPSREGNARALGCSAAWKSERALLRRPVGGLHSFH